MPVRTVLVPGTMFYFFVRMSGHNMARGTVLLHEILLTGSTGKCHVMLVQVVLVLAHTLTCRAIFKSNVLAPLNKNSDTIRLHVF